jgi:biopolymer transport protein ExbB/TolQ
MPLKKEQISLYTTVLFVLCVFGIIYIAFIVLIMLFIALKNKNKVTKSNRKLNKKRQKISVNNKERNESKFQNMSQIIETNERKSNEKIIEERKSEEIQNQK